METALKSSLHAHAQEVSTDCIKLAEQIRNLKALIRDNRVGLGSEFLVLSLRKMEETLMMWRHEYKETMEQIGNM